MHTLGIDLGATYARAGVVDETGNVLGVAKVPHADRSPAGVIEAVASAVDQALQTCPDAKVGPCGVGVAAQLEGATGAVLVAPNLGWRNVPFGGLLAKRLGREVRVVNDLSAAAWGEFIAGAGRGEHDVLTVFVGSGVGSAIIAEGLLIGGSRGVAGEIGHVKVVPGGRLCGCGERGCLEAYAGGRNLIAQMIEVISAGKAPVLAKVAAGGEPTPVHLEQALEQGEPAAQEIHGQATRFLALCIGNQITMLNPARLILGGGVFAHAPRMRRQVEQQLMEIASVASRRTLQVRDPALGDDAGMVGAALLARLPLHT